ncbi:MAG: translation initiation factor IF-2 [Patescibacteria group bacterium]|jgi:translation initiation factor IF-2|nr:translation initiation factor IF-2 [Patescibacteria group bacterium]
MTEPEDKKIVSIPSQLTVKELSDKLDMGIAEVLKKLMENGIIANLNDTIDFETAYIISEELGFTAEEEALQENSEIFTIENLKEELEEEAKDEKNLSLRPPVVTILGHVDHGKTTLLDTLRKAHIAEGESGGITQHITAYQVKKKDQLITFIDTPGHEAFQSMRQRGAAIADITILVVAADDGVKPQTKEVVKFLIENKIPTVVAINKIDKPEANVNRVKQELAEIGLLLEGYGGDTPFNEISAKNNTGIDELLDTLLLVSDIHEFKSNDKKGAIGIVLESHKDPQRGPIATVLIKTGTLEVGDDIIIGKIVGRVRGMEDYNGKTIREASPSTPATIIGLPKSPESNDVFKVEANKAELKRKIKQFQGIDKNFLGGLLDLSSKQLIKNIDETKKTKLPIILKTDVRGSLEAVVQILQSLPSDEIQIDIIKNGVGSITESDIKAAQSGTAIVYGFNVFPTSIATRMAQDSEIKIKTYNVIYELIEDIKNEMSELLEPEIKRTDLGRMKVLAIFKSGKGQMIVGGKVNDGKIVKGEKMEILREKIHVGSGKLIQLQQNKEEAEEVKSGLECGITFEGKEKIEVGDSLISYKEEEIKRKI